MLSWNRGVTRIQAEVLMIRMVVCHGGVHPRGDIEVADPGDHDGFNHGGGTVSITSSAII